MKFPSRSFSSAAFMLIFSLSMLLAKGQNSELSPVVALPKNLEQADSNPSATKLWPLKILEKGTRKPLAGVTLILKPQSLKYQSNGQGEINLELEKLTFPQKGLIYTTGYENISFEWQENNLDLLQKTPIYLARKNQVEVFESFTNDKKLKRDLSSRGLKREQFLKMAGSGGDPIRAVQNLPGIARSGAFQGRVAIQGSSPNDTRFLIEGHEVPIIFHFGGLSSVVLPEAVERVDYLSAGYGSEYGRAMGGLIGIKVRAADEKQKSLSGFAFVDLLNSGGLLQGSFKFAERDVKILFGLRKSYIGEVLGLVGKNNPSFNFTVAPAFEDAVLSLQTDLNEAMKLKVVGVASNDELSFVLKEPVRQNPSLRGSFSNQTGFYRIIPVFTWKTKDFQFSSSASIGQDKIKFEVGDNYFLVNSLASSWRSELELESIESKWKQQFGFDHRLNVADVNIRLPNVSQNGGVMGGFDSSSVKETKLKQQKNIFYGFYWRNEIQYQAMNWAYPQLRLDYFGPIQQWMFQPRLAMKWADEGDDFFYRLASGIYAQAPTEQQIDPTFGNPAVKASQAYHLAVGLEKDLKTLLELKGFSVILGGFYRYFDSLVVNSKNFIQRDGKRVAEQYNNQGRGKAFGFETQIKYQNKQWDTWLSYTLSRSTRWNQNEAESLFQFDQTHLLTWILAYNFSNQFSLSSRLRYVTGNPFTPIISAVFDADADRYNPIRGDIFSARFDPFFQWDLRVDKQFVFDTWILSLYLDIQNVSNQKNPEQMSYSYDYSQKEVIAGLPFFPTLGLKGEF